MFAGMYCYCRQGEFSAMSDALVNLRPIVPRKGPDIEFDDSLPRFWMDDDPFKTRFFDAMSTLFPEGEKFFIQCVRDYREQVTDPVLAAEMREFIYQEGQHGAVHRRYNECLKRQGVNVDSIEGESRLAFSLFRKRLQKGTTLAQTAALEHFTAIMCHGFMTRAEIFANADPRMRAVFYWHAIEEIEHKAVAFDVLTKIAGVSYRKRAFTMLWMSIIFPLHTFLIMRHMLRVDGFSGWQRFKLWTRGLWWLYRPGGMILPLLPHYFAYYRLGFHPWQDGSMDAYRRWRGAYDSTGDTVLAGTSVHAAA